MTSSSKKIFVGLCIFTAVVLGLFIFSATTPTLDTAKTTVFTVEPLSQASFALVFADLNILYNPVAPEQEYSGLAKPDLILISDTESEHFSVDTLLAVVTASTTIIAPESVFAALPALLQDKAIVMSYGDAHTINQLSIEVLALSHSPELAEKTGLDQARGNGYILEISDTRIYIAANTDKVKQMQSLQDIQIAFIPLNPPDTMDATLAADAVLAFTPKIVYPYHYHQVRDFAVVEQFEQLVTAGNSDIDVRLLDWYTE